MVYSSHQEPEQTTKSCYLEFAALVPSEIHAVDYVIGVMGEEGKRCRFCGGTKTTRQFGDRRVFCLSGCGPTRPLAVTFFRSKKKIRPYLGAIHLMERGMWSTANEYKDLAGIAYATAHKIELELSTVIGNELLKSESQTHCLLFSEIVFRRTRLTPAGEHPIVELTETESPEVESFENLVETQPPEGHNNPLEKMLNELGDTIDGIIARRALEVIRCGSVRFDDLCSQLGVETGPLSAVLVMLELYGLVNREAGDCWTIAVNGNSGRDASLESGADTMISLVNAIIAYISSTSGGVSFRYLQNYVSIFWCNVDKSRWARDALTTACIRTRPLIERSPVDNQPLRVLKLPPSSLQWSAA